MFKRSKIIDSVYKYITGSVQIVLVNESGLYCFSLRILAFCDLHGRCTQLVERSLNGRINKRVRGSESYLVSGFRGSESYLVSGFRG